MLCYHAVSERWPAALSVTPEALDAQLRLLARCGYRGVTFTELALAPTPGKVVALTFDDAYMSVRELAAPILQRHGFPGTVFVPTSFIGSTEPMSWPGIEQWLGTEHRDELLPMGWKELRELAADGWEIGSHTRTHPHLTQLEGAELIRELTEAKRECEVGMGATCRTLAYPYGEHDERVTIAAADAGYEAACTLSGKLRDASMLRWPRVGIYQGDLRLRFLLKSLPPSRALRGSRLGRRAAGSRGRRSSP